MDQLLDEFPNYDYRHPKHPWLLTYRKAQQGTAGLQIQAFHYWWAIESGKSGQIGLSLLTPNLPFCLCVGDSNAENIHLQADPLMAHELLRKSPFPLIVTSAVIPYVPCLQKNTARCQGQEAIDRLVLWAELLNPGGRVIGVLFDEHYANKNGWQVKEKIKATHTWTANQFYQQLLPLAEDGIFQIEEFDTLKNEFAFNFVLRMAMLREEK